TIVLAHHAQQPTAFARLVDELVQVSKPVNHAIQASETAKADDKRLHELAQQVAIDDQESPSALRARFGYGVGHWVKFLAFESRCRGINASAGHARWRVPKLEFQVRSVPLFGLQNLGEQCLYAAADLRPDSSIRQARRALPLPRPIALGPPL